MVGDSADVTVVVALLELGQQHALRCWVFQRCRLPSLSWWLGVAERTSKANKAAGKSCRKVNARPLLKPVRLTNQPAGGQDGEVKILWNLTNIVLSGEDTMDMSVNDKPAISLRVCTRGIKSKRL